MFLTIAAFRLVKENFQSSLYHINLSFISQHKENYLEIALFNVQWVFNSINVRPCPFHNEISFAFNISNSLFFQKVF